MESITPSMVPSTFAPDIPCPLCVYWGWQLGGHSAMCGNKDIVCKTQSIFPCYIKSQYILDI